MTHDSSDTGTIVHLPECKALDTMPEATRMFYSTSRQWFWEHGCICDRLRACEQRVRARYSAYLNADNEGCYAAGFRDALDAAREAVAAMPPMEGWKTRPVGRVDLVDKWSALAAIDGLREKP